MRLRSRHPFQLSAPMAVMVIVVAALLGGCGGADLGDRSSSEPVDEEKGRALFQTTCRVCHALSDAEAAGVFGPDLDLLQPDAKRVREQINDGGGGMPSGLLDGGDADLVARYVAAAAGRGGGSDAAPQSRRGAVRPAQTQPNSQNPKEPTDG